MATDFLQIYNNSGDETTLRPDGSVKTFQFVTHPDLSRKYRLFFAGESSIFYWWKNEPDYQFHYHSLTDSLDTVHAFKAQYCLNMSSSKPEQYIRRAYRKVDWPPILSYLSTPVSDNMRFGIWLRTENVKVFKNGFLRMRMEIRLQKEGVEKESIALPPDYVFDIDLSQNTSDKWCELSRDINVPSNEIAHVGVLIEGVNYNGNVYVERPHLMTGNGWNLLPDFSVPVSDRQHFDWTAQYLSRKEWPSFRIDLNGKNIYSGEIFERCHMNSEWEITIPDNTIAENNTLAVSLTSNYHDPIPYTIHEIGLISEPAGIVTLVAVGKTAVSQGSARLLFETSKDNVDITITSHDNRVKGGIFHFAEKGLHGVRLSCGGPGEHIPLVIESGNTKIDCEIQRIAIHADDGVVTGTGDMIYIHQDMDSFRQYIKWYVENGVGDLLTLRPTYRWSGSRVLDNEAWKEFNRVLTELGITYVHMWDGRELPGQNTNPDATLLASPMFRGSQMHERDGAGFYWGLRSSQHSLFTRQIWEMRQRIFDEDPDHTYPEYCHKNFFWEKGEMYWLRPPCMPRDAKQAHDIQVRHLADIRNNSATRHTGPSVLFKYFLEAGYKWTGFESMYTTTEPYMAFLRGAALYGGVKHPGVHHAMQWSSSPHDAPEHVRRYRLALYSSYMQGADEINTEEGLWHIEEYYSGYNRFGKTCQEHLKQQQDFFKFVQTHSRTGKFHTPVALLHGRFDGWHGFGGDSQWWGVKDKDVKSTPAEKSWDLLKVFYPLAAPGVPVYYHYCPTDREPGYQSGTPNGNIDVIPVESSGELIGTYRALAFMGYNCAEKDDLDKLLLAVENGCRLLLTRAHLTDTTSYDDLASGKLSQLPHPIASTDGVPRFVDAKYNGLPIRICENILPSCEITVRTDEGLPLVMHCKHGKGEVIIVNTDLYPSDPVIRALYENELRNLLAKETAKEPVWCECGNDVAFSVYKQDDGSSHVYFLADDWYHDPAPVRHARLRVGTAKYDVSVPFGVLVKAIVRDNIAAWTDTEDAEILSIDNGSITVQGTGECTFTIASNAKTRKLKAEFTSNSVITAQLR